MFKSLLLAAGVVSTNAVFFSNDANAQKYMWSQFKQEYNKKYSDDAEDTKRFNIFINNLKEVDVRNARESNKVHGMTKFSDMTSEEFQSQYLGAKVSMKSERSQRDVVDNVEPYTLSATADWSGKYTTPVKDQGYCGSCWAFSATEQLESDTMRVLGKTFVLSCEQTTQCTPAPSAGCGGGWTESAYKYIKSVPGLETEANYPYTSYQGRTGTCAVKGPYVVGLTGYTTIGGSTVSAVETNMANYVLATGPLSVCLDASSWNSYTGGIMTQCGQSVDHCVQAVGVNTATTGGYWKVRNSWGVSWGESGYIRLAYGKNTCDITNDPTYVAPKLV